MGDEFSFTLDGLPGVTMQQALAVMMLALPDFSIPPFHMCFTESTSSLETKLVVLHLGFQIRENEPPFEIKLPLFVLLPRHILVNLINQQLEAQFDRAAADTPPHSGE